MRTLLFSLLLVASFICAPARSADASTAGISDELVGYVVCEGGVTKDLRIFVTAKQLALRIQECVDDGGTVGEIVFR